LVACKSGDTTKQSPVTTPRPHTFVYKTTKDYSQFVPVLLSDDKTQIVSYPHPRDLKRGAVFMLPTPLKKGYWLDNRGIGLNVAFLKFTYREYSEFSEAPDIDELYKNIMDKDPLVELCDCGNTMTFAEREKQVNDLIESNRLKTICKQIK
jgi:hypothetical protein